MLRYSSLIALLLLVAIFTKSLATPPELDNSGAVADESDDADEEANNDQISVPNQFSELQASFLTLTAERYQQTN